MWCNHGNPAVQGSCKETGKQAVCRKEALMKALILNSGTGSRMGDLTRTHPKCMTEIGGGETILSRQLTLIREAFAWAASYTGAIPGATPKECGNAAEHDPERNFRQTG